MKIRRAKLALAGFVPFLIVLVVLPDSGHGQCLFGLAGRVPAGDKIGHFILFGVFALLVNVLWRAETLPMLGVRVLKGGAVVMALAALEEASQALFRARSFDLVDLASDAVGIWLFGRLAVAYLHRKRQPPRTVTVTVR